MNTQNKLQTVLQSEQSTRVDNVYSERLQSMMDTRSTVVQRTEPISISKLGTGMAVIPEVSSVQSIDNVNKLVSLQNVAQISQLIGITAVTPVTPIAPITPIGAPPLPVPLDFQFNIKPGTRYPSSNRFKPTTAVHPLADYRIFFKRKFGFLGAPGKTKKVNIYKPKYYNPEGSDVGFTAARIKELL